MISDESGASIENRLEVGVDALDFVKSIPDEIWKKIDTVVWDPPYFDINNHKHVERFHGGGWGKTRFTNKKTVLGDWNIINKIIDLIYIKIQKGSVIYFDSRDNQYNFSCKIIWNKMRPSITGGVIMPYHEYIWLDPINIKYTPRSFPSVLSHKTIPGKRTAYKPFSLFMDLFNRLDSKFIFDPFAGYGNSIHAANKLGIPIYACDIDTKLNWDKAKPLEDWFD